MPLRDNPAGEIDLLVRAINDTESTSYRLAGKMAGGTTGAYVLDPDAVLKVRPGKMAWWVRRGQITVDALRAVGYPASDFFHVGEIGETTYWIIERLPGATGDELREDTFPLLLDLIELTADLEPKTDQDWSKGMKTVPLDDAFGWCKALRAASEAAARLVDEMQSVIEPLRDIDIPNRDAVHGDFGPHNVLFHHGRVSGVIDCEAAGRGTRLYDLGSLRRRTSSQVMRDEIDRRAIAIAGEGPYALFQAYRLLDGLHWTLHREGKAAFDAHVASSNDDLDRIRQLV